MIAKQWKKSGLLTGAAGVLVLMMGCCPPPPPNEAVLEGTWLLTGAAVPASVTNFLISFDSNGQITQVQYTTNGVTFTINSLESTSSVNDLAVSITATGSNGINSFVFNGNFTDNTYTVANGQMGYQFVSGGVTIESPTQPATATKQ